MTQTIHPACATVVALLLWESPAAAQIAPEAGADVAWYRARPLGIRAMAGVTVRLGE